MLSSSCPHYDIILLIGKYSHDSKKIINWPVMKSPSHPCSPSAQYPRQESHFLIYTSKVSLCVYKQIQIQIVISPAHPAVSPVLSRALPHGGLSGLRDFFHFLYCHMLFHCQEAAVIYLASPLLMGIWVVPNICCYKPCRVDYLVHRLHRN